MTAWWTFKLCNKISTW